MSEITLGTTDRGFAIARLVDRNGAVCSLQESSVATENLVWLGVSGVNRMHLSQDQVAALLPLLQHFVETGALPSPPRKDET